MHRVRYTIPLAAALLALLPWLLQAQGQPPHVFIGAAYIDGVVAEPGTEVAAYDGDRRTGHAVTREDGSYRLDVSSSLGTITFTVGDAPAAESFPAWTSGMRTRDFVLTAATQDPVCVAAAGSSSTANAVQSHELPHIFIGQATIGGATVAPGTEITAWDGSIFLGSATTRNDGWYTIRVTRSRGPISFKIGGAAATRTHSPWVSGEITGEFHIMATAPANCLVGVVPVEDFVAAFGNKIEAVFSFDEASKRWLFYDPELAQFSDLTHMTPGRPYFIQVTQNFQARLNGSDRRLTCLNGNCWNILVW